MRFTPVLRTGVLIRRYKRFLADVETPMGETLTMHCANTGAMIGCAEPGSAVWYSESANPKRKYRHTLEIVRNHEGHYIGVNTSRANALVADAIAEGLVPGIASSGPIRREVAIPGERGRFDLLVGGVFVEVKSVTLKLEDSGAFPDAVSVRATRHVDALARLAQSGRPAALVFCVLHGGIAQVRSADEIDAAYGAALRRAATVGVRIVALGCRISPQGIVPIGTLPVSPISHQAACRRQKALGFH